MSPEQCGTGGVPADHPDRPVVDALGQFLQEAARRGDRATAADPAWREWSASAPVPAAWVGCAVAP